MEIQRLHSSIFSDYLLIIFNCLEELHRNSMTEELSLVLINGEKRNIKNDQKNYRSDCWSFVIYDFEWMEINSISILWISQLLSWSEQIIEFIKSFHFDFDLISAIITYVENHETTTFKKQQTLFYTYAQTTFLSKTFDKL